MQAQNSVDRLRAWQMLESPSGTAHGFAHAVQTKRNVMRTAALPKWRRGKSHGILVDRLGYLLPGSSARLPAPGSRADQLTGFEQPSDLSYIADVGKRVHSE